MRRLALVTNNAYTTVLLMDGDRVVGAWDAALPRVMAEFLRDRKNPDAVWLWDESWPEQTAIADYGEECDERAIDERADFYGCKQEGGE